MTVHICTILGVEGHLTIAVDFNFKENEIESTILIREKQGVIQFQRLFLLLLLLPCRFVSSFCNCGHT